MLPEPEATGRRSLAGTGRSTPRGGRPCALDDRRARRLARRMEREGGDTIEVEYLAGHHLGYPPVDIMIRCRNTGECHVIRKGTDWEALQRGGLLTREVADGSNV
jgi:hypothetical protein